MHYFYAYKREKIDPKNGKSSGEYTQYYESIDQNKVSQNLSQEKQKTESQYVQTLSATEQQEAQQKAKKEFEETGSWTHTMVRMLQA